MQLDRRQTNIKVVCRFRPLNTHQKQQSSIITHQLLDDKTVKIKDSTKQDKNTHNQPHIFTFDKIFNCNSTQHQVYLYTAASIINDILQGYNGTILTYGQTSSGKTYTMQGQYYPNNSIGQCSGIIPRMIAQIFKEINQYQVKVEFKIKVSIVEIYKQKIRDLINVSKNDLKIRSEKKRGIFIENLTQIYVSSAKEIYQLLESTRSIRATASTNMNEHSSRSHLIFMLTINQNNPQQMIAKTGKLYLVDLAGSQKVRKTGAEGNVLEQAKKINGSLTVLGKVIYSLTQGKSKHVPYRDSKLTRILQQSLGGNSKTTLIVTCSPHLTNIAETISSLRFGISAKKIKNKPQINKQLTISQLQLLLQKVQKTLLQKQLYIKQLTNYILIDLNHKFLPTFNKKSQQIQQRGQCYQNQQDELDKITQLQRQVEFQKNLNQNLENQSKLLYEKNQKIYQEKEMLENQLQLCKIKILELEKHILSIEGLNKTETSSVVLSVPALGSRQSSTDQLLPTDYPTLDQPQTPTDRLSYPQLSQLYQQIKKQQQLQKQQLKKNDTILVKKLQQLQNNLVHLTRQYYNLLIIYQKYKFQNRMINIKFKQKNIYINTLKCKISQLQQQNRLLEQSKQFDTSFRSSSPSNKSNSTYGITQQNNQKFKSLYLCPPNPVNYNATLVKIFHGGKNQLDFN